MAIELTRDALGLDGSGAATSPGLDSLSRRLAHLSIWIAALVALFGIGTEVWHPFALGFVHDDWYLFVRLHDLGFYMDLHDDRPGYYLLSLMILHIWNGSPVAFQLIKVVINLATAGSILWLTLTLQRMFRVTSPVLATGAATLWLIAPWGLGYTVWATSAFTNVALLYFCVSMVQFVRFVERGSWVGLVVAILLWTISIETYQATWFAFLPVSLAVWLAVHDRPQLRNRLLILAAILLAVQFGSLVHTALTTPKVRNPNVVGAFWTNVREIWNIHVRFLGLWTCLLAVGVVVGAAIAARRDSSGRYLNLRRIVAGTLLVILGACGSAALYASAGYQFAGAGEMSKTCVMFTFWVAMGFSVALASDAADKRKALLATATSLLVTAVALVQYPGMARPWIASWQLQREVIDTIKGQSFPRRLEPGDVVLSDVPREVSGIAVFGAPWSITPAAMSAWADVIPSLARQGLWPVMIVPYDPKMTWEAGTLTMGPGWTAPAKRLWFWRWRTGDAVLMQGPGPLPPKPFETLFDGHQGQ